MKALFSLIPYFKKYQYRTLAGFIFILLANIFKTVNPMIIQTGLNRVVAALQNTNPNTSAGLGDEVIKNSLLFLLIYLGVALLEAGFTFFMRQTIIVVSRLIEFDMKNNLYAQYQKLDLAFYRKNNTGDLMNRITEDVSRVRMFLGPSIMYTVNMVFMVAFASFAMFHVHVKLALCVLIPLPIITLLIYFLNSKINQSNEIIQAKLSEVTSFVQEAYSGIRVVQSYSKEKQMVDLFDSENEEYKTALLKLAKLESIYFPLITFLVGLSMAILIYYGGILVARKEIGVGSIISFVLYINMLTFPVSALGWAVSLMQRATVSMRRINDFLNIPSTVINDEALPTNLEGEITFQNVSFIYPDSGIQGLKNVSFTIKKGERWAIVGKTGSGKSTIADLCMRMYDVSEGSILVDGKNIKNWNTKSLRNQIGFVPQDVFLFSENVKDNINFGVQKEELDELQNAQLFAGYASIHHEITAFAEGYETIVGERGVTLSGGQKQRISIARALAKHPQVLILDDSLSAVDAQTEFTIEQNLNEQMKNKTAIIITHRVFTSLHFDQIIVLENGAVSDIGTHEMLLQKNKLYQELYQLQSAEK